MFSIVLGLGTLGFLFSKLHLAFDPGDHVCVQTSGPNAAAARALREVAGLSVKARN